MIAAQRHTPARWQADLALASVALVWGATFVVVKQTLPEISTMYFLALRFALASLCLFFVFFRAFRSVPSSVTLRGLRGGAIAGLFLWVGYVLQTIGLKYTTAGKSGFLTGLYVVLVPLLDAATFRRWPQARELLGIAIAGIGMVVLTVPSLDGPLSVNKGDLLTVGCAVAFAFQVLVLGYYSKRERVEAVALGQIACAAVLSTFALPIEVPRANWSAGVIFAIVLTAVFATAVAFALQTWGQRHTTATRTALIFALEPVFALATAITAGGERLTISAVIGGAFILTGILAVELKPARES